MPKSKDRKYSVRSRGGYRGPTASKVTITHADGTVEHQPAKPDGYSRWGEKAARSLKRKQNPAGATQTLGEVAPCPECGLLVHVCGRLVSYHAPINGCQAAERPRPR